MASGFTYKVEGFEQVAQALKEITSDIVKKREIVKILKREASPAIRAMERNAPIEKNWRTIKKKVVDRKTNKKKVASFTPGNLKRSMKLFTGKSKDYPTVYVGAQTKKAESSGYYGYFVQYGTKGKRGIRAGKYDFRTVAENEVDGVIGNGLQAETVKYLKRSFSKRFNVTV
jgi:hypothetical protein